MHVALAKSKFGIHSLIGDDSLIHYYTGFPSFRVLRAFYAFIGPSVFQLTYWETDEPKSKRVSRTNGPATDDANVIIASFPGRLPLRFLDRRRDL